jgi:trehalose 6-phosphate synthase/phosphatase
MKLIIIANRLPLKATKTEYNNFEFARSEGGLTTGMDSLNLDVEKHWVGWPGTFAEDETEENSIKEHLKEFNFHPVFLTPDQVENYYEGYSNNVLWPLCHYFYAFVEYEKVYWEAYKAVNEVFKSTALPIIEPGDIVWVQDYQLMLLPKLLRSQAKDISIGYFHHIPFPSYELFRIIPERDELLEGLLGADLIGFHTHDYMRHFVSAVERVLDMKFKFEQLMVDNRVVSVDNFPMGINYQLYNDAILQTPVKLKVDQLKESIGKQKLILSVDRLDYSKGILHRLKAFTQFLENNPEYHEKVSMAMIVVPSRDTVERYAELKTKIDETIGTLNGRFSTLTWNPVHYFYHGFDFDELLAMYHVADIALVTPLRDGMNLVAKEYVAAKRDSPGVLILSEMAGAAIELTDAIIINPNDMDEIEQGLIKAMTMPENEQMQKLRKMQKVVRKQNVNKWADDFVNELKETRLKSENLNAERIDPQTIAQMNVDYDAAKSRLFILDYDGTLSAFKSRPEDAFPAEDTLQLLSQLCADAKNDVVISSGRDRQTLEKWFGHLPIDMAAEHGAYYKQNGAWNSNISDEKLWNDEIVDILQSYVDKTPRAEIEVKKTALVWHYRNVDTWLAALREQQLFEDLIMPCSKQSLQIMRGNKIIEIKSPHHSKGSEAQRLLARKNYDFIIAMGDDTTDEDTFKELPGWAYTIKVSGVSEFARFSVKSQTKVLPLLKKVIGMD